METQQALYQYAVRLGDNSLIMAQRLAEWCSNGPILEEDLALTNAALDYLGEAENYYNYALSLEPDGRTADDLAYLRNERQYYNCLLAEQPNGDYAQTMVKLALFSAYLKLLYEALSQSTDANMSALASKSLKEVKYHFRHSSEWMIRFGHGTDESKARAQQAIYELWRFTADMFETTEADVVLKGLVPDQTSIQNEWNRVVDDLLARCGLSKPEDTYQVKGGYQAKHTEHLGHILCELQFLQRAHPGAKW